MHACMQGQGRHAKSRGEPHGTCHAASGGGDTDCAVVTSSSGQMGCMASTLVRLMLVVCGYDVCVREGEGGGGASWWTDGSPIDGRMEAEQRQVR